MTDWKGPYKCEKCNRVFAADMLAEDGNHWNPKIGACHGKLIPLDRRAPDGREKQIQEFIALNKTIKLLQEESEKDLTDSEYLHTEIEKRELALAEMRSLLQTIYTLETDHDAAGTEWHDAWEQWLKDARAVLAASPDDGMVKEVRWLLQNASTWPGPLSERALGKWIERRDALLSKFGGK